MLLKLKNRDHLSGDEEQFTVSEKLPVGL